MTCVQAEELPLQEIVKASNVLGFEKGLAFGWAVGMLRLGKAKRGRVVLIG